MRSVALACRARHSVFLDRYSLAIAVTVPAFSDALVTTPVMITVTITIDIDANAAGSDPHVGLRQRDRIVDGACKRRERRQAESSR
jgi:hypothetical protein